MANINKLDLSGDHFKLIIAFCLLQDLPVAMCVCKMWYRCICELLEQRNFLRLSLVCEDGKYWANGYEIHSIRSFLARFGSQVTALKYREDTKISVQEIINSCPDIRHFDILHLRRELVNIGPKLITLQTMSLLATNRIFDKMVNLRSLVLTCKITGLANANKIPINLHHITVPYLSDCNLGRLAKQLQSLHCTRQLRFKALVPLSLFSVLKSFRLYSMMT